MRSSIYAQKVVISIFDFSPGKFYTMSVRTFVIPFNPDPVPLGQKIRIRQNPKPDPQYCCDHWMRHIFEGKRWRLFSDFITFWNFTKWKLQLKVTHQFIYVQITYIWLRLPPSTWFHWKIGPGIFARWRLPLINTWLKDYHWYSWKVGSGGGIWCKMAAAPNQHLFDGLLYTDTLQCSDFEFFWENGE